MQRDERRDRIGSEPVSDSGEGERGGVRLADVGNDKEIEE